MLSDRFKEPKKIIIITFLFGILITIPAGYLNCYIMQTFETESELNNALLGGFFGYAVIWLIIFFYKKVRNKEGMGLGDAKLMAVVGFWFGWASIPFTIFISSAVALVLVIPSLIKKTRNMSAQIPFGPYIIIGCIIYVTFANQIKYLL